MAERPAIMFIVLANDCVLKRTWSCLHSWRKTEIKTVLFQPEQNAKAAGIVTVGICSLWLGAQTANTDCDCLK